MRKSHPPIKIDDKFERWTVIGFDANSLYVRCRCVCGEERRVNKKNLKAGGTKSCGCWDIDQKKKHGMSRTRTYKLWQSMLNRVRLNAYYIDLGIKICDRWQGVDGFANFLADMGECPPDKKSLDRYPDPSGNYEPGNCRWATDSEQQLNKTTTERYRVGDEELTLTEWAKKTGMTFNTLSSRLERGWSIERAVATPQGLRRGRGTPQSKDKLIEYKGESKTLAQWAEQFGLHITTMIERVWRKWPMEKIERTPQGYRSDTPAADERNRLLKGDPNLTAADGVVTKYLMASEARRHLQEVLESASPQCLEAMFNAVHGGARPKLRIPGSIATHFAVRPD